LEDDSNQNLVKKIISFLKKKPHLQNGTDLAEEIHDLIDEGHAKGFITDEESDMFQGVLELKETKAHSIMIPRTEISSAPADSTLKEFIDLITACGHTRIPVYKNNIDEIVGILHAKDLLKFLGEDPDSRILPEIFRKPYFVPENKNINELLRDLRAKKTHLAIITDEYGGTEGIIAIEDIIEEIVGEIEDEHDNSTPLFYALDENSVIVDARMEVSKFVEHFGIELPSGEYESVGGFIIHLLGKIPKQGEMLTHENMEIQIKSADERKIDKIQITLKNQPESLQKDTDQH